MKEQFIIFLKKNHAWKEFKSNLESNSSDFCKYYFSRENIILKCAFLFDKTEQGLEYWLELDKEWEKIKDA